MKYFLFSFDKMLLFLLQKDIKRYLIKKYLDRYDTKILFDAYGLSFNDPKLYIWASKRGYVNIMNYYYDSNTELHHDAAYWAARSGEHKCVKFIKEKTTRIDPNACGNIALAGDLEGLKYCYENSENPYVDWVCCNASLKGHLSCLKYGHEKEMKWDYKTCSHASLNGHLECLKYAHVNGCEWLCDTIENAYKNKRKECLRYAIEHGCPNPNNREIL
jgi:hypothetical protein